MVRRPAFDFGVVALVAAEGSAGRGEPKGRSMGGLSTDHLWRCVQEVRDARY